jgi:hypothetical protein
VHNHRGTNGFINNNIKSKVYDHSVKTYEQVTKTHSGFRFRDSDTAMGRLREMTLSGEEVHVPAGSGASTASKLPSHSCQPRLVDDYRLHLDSLLGTALSLSLSLPSFADFLIHLITHLLSALLKI